MNNDPKLEFKVGLFIAAGLALLAALVLNFTKGVTLFKPTYQLHVQMQTAAGLKTAADVMMAGVTIGKVTRIDLDKDGHGVTITAELLSKFQIRQDAVFHIDALGFLGDQYVEVTTPPGPAPAGVGFLKNGDTIRGEPPFNLQEAVRSTTDLLDAARKTLGEIDQAITNINRTVLSASTLADFTLSLSNIEALSESAMTVVSGARQLISSNQIGVSSTVSNLQTLSVKLDAMADELNGVIVTNRDPLNETIRNFRDTSGSLKQVAADLQAGRGWRAAC